MLKLAWRMLWRDWRSGELALLALALVLAVTAITGVGFFTERVQRGLQRDAAKLIGADVLLSADAPLPPAWRVEAQRRGLRVAALASFPSMASTADAAQLAAVKFVEQGYPLRGETRIASALGSAGRLVQGGPQAGELWLEERLFAALGVKVGDSLQLGRARLRIAAVLTFESDKGGGFSNFMPRILANMIDLPATQLEQPGSRIRYRLQVAAMGAASDAQVADFLRWVTPQINPGQQVETLENGRPELRNNLERIGRFLRLASMLTVVLAAVVISLSLRRYLARHWTACAAMRCFGAGRTQLFMLFSLEFSLLALLAALLGGGLGFALQGGIAALAGRVLQADLPVPSLIPVLQGLAAAWVLTLGFVLPPLLAMSRVAPIAVLREEWGAQRAQQRLAWGSGALALLALFVWLAGEWRLGVAVGGGFAAVMGLSMLGVAGLIRLLGRLRHGVRASWGLRQASAALLRRSGAVTVTVTALALGLMAMLLLGLVADDLLRGWQKGLRAEVPNQFVLNIQPEQREAVQQTLAQQGLGPVTLLPMIRGRLVSVRGQAVRAEQFAEERARSLVDREFNLSYASQLPAGNSIKAGEWHGERQAPSFSMEAGLGKTLGIQLGDEVVFEIAGQRVAGRVGSIRQLDWDSMRVNFFFIAAPGLLETQPASWITSFYLPPGKQASINALLAAFPNLTVVDVGAIIAEVQSLSLRLIRVVQAVLGLALLAGVLVLWASLRVSVDERRHELAVLRSLGARRQQLRHALLWEFGMLATLAAALGAVGALAVGYGLSLTVLNIPYQPAWWSLGGYVLLAIFGIVGAAWLGIRRLLAQTVIDGLRV